MRKKLRIGNVGNRRVLQAERTAWVPALRQEDIYWTESQPVWLGHRECTWGDARQRLIYARSMDLALYSKATGSHWRICKRKVRRLDLFFRAQSAVCGSCCLPAYSGQTLQPHWRQPASSSIHGILQARILSGFPFSSFILLLHSVTLSTFYFFFKAYLFCLCWVLAVSGLSLVAAAMPRLLLAVASLVLEHRL